MSDRDNFIKEYLDLCLKYNYCIDGFTISRISEYDYFDNLLSSDNKPIPLYPSLFLRSIENDDNEQILFEDTI